MSYIPFSLFFYNFSPIILAIVLLNNENEAGDIPFNKLKQAHYINVGQPFPESPIKLRIGLIRGLLDARLKPCPTHNIIYCICISKVRKR